MRATTVAAAIVGGVGGVLLAAGALTFTFFSGIADRERQRIERLEPLDAIALTDIPAGREVLVEGRIAPAQPRLFRDFVAYQRLEIDRSAEEPDTWRLRETQAPDLRLDIPEGTLRVRGPYSLRGTRTWRGPHPVSRVDSRYEGLVTADAVVVIGTMAGDALDAEVVATGTRATCLAGIDAGRRVVRWLGLILMSVGSLLLIVALVLVVVGRRMARA